MPAPVLYVVVAVVGVAVAGVAFKEFVYDPHVAPKLEAWTLSYAAYRQERRRKKAAPHKNTNDNKGESLDTVDKASVELETLIDRETNTPGQETLLRRRNPTSKDIDDSGLIENSNVFIPFIPLTPASAQSASISSDEPLLPMSHLPPPSPGTVSPELLSGNSNSLQVAEVSSSLYIYENPFGSSASSHSHVIPPEPGALSGSEHNFTLPSSGTSEDMSRMGTPFTDAMSGGGEMLSNASFSDVTNSDIFSATAEDYPPTHRVDHTVFDAGDIFTDGHSEESFSSSDGSSLDSLSDESDESDVYINRTALSDEEWERLSEVAR